MTNKISPREWEALSAYLDGQLGPKERTQLEARLEKDSELRLAADDLKQMKMVLRAQPKLRAPRNFTLTPAMVGARNRPLPMVGPFPWLRLTSAMAGILLVLVFLGDLFAGAPPVPSTAYYAQPPLSPAEQQAMESAPAGMGGEFGTMAEDTARSAENPDAALSAKAFPEAAPEQAPAPDGTQAEEPAVPEVEQPAAAQDASPESTPAPEEQALAAPAEGAANETPAEPEISMFQQEPMLDEGQGGSMQTAPVSPFINPLAGLSQAALRTIEIALALVTLGAGLAAYLLFRSRGV